MTKVLRLAFVGAGSLLCLQLTTLAHAELDEGCEAGKSVVAQVVSDVAALPVDGLRPDSCGFLRHLDKGERAGVITQEEILGYIDRFGRVPGELETFEIAAFHNSSSTEDPALLLALQSLAQGELSELEFSSRCATPPAAGEQLATIQAGFNFDGPVTRIRGGGYIDDAGNKLTFRRNYNVRVDDELYDRYSTLAVLESPKGGSPRTLDVEPGTAAFLADFMHTNRDSVAFAAARNPGGGANTAMIQIMNKALDSAPESTPYGPLTMEQLASSSFGAHSVQRASYDFTHADFDKTTVFVRWELPDGERGSQLPAIPRGRVTNMEIAYKVGRGPLPEGQRLLYRSATKAEVQALLTASQGGGVGHSIWDQANDQDRDMHMMNLIAVGASPNS